MHDHIVIVTDLTKVREDDPKLSSSATQGCLYCANCGQHYNVEYPISFNMIDGISRGFRKDHKRCKRFW
jgi:transcription elongation factor Elf1